MNLSPITYNYANKNNYSIRKMKQNVAFCGEKTIVEEKAKENAGCAINVLLAVALVPLALLSEIFTNKNDEIERMITGIQSEYEEHYGNYKHFELITNEMNKFLNKHTKNEEYAQFVRESMNFLKTNFEKNSMDRMELFESSNQIESKVKWLRFMETVKNSAKAAVSKNYKNIDIEKLNKDIQLSKEIMQN